jgi:hypothetical protein
MGILERLRPTPRWKHTDPAVRVAAVYELAAADAEALRALAREDSEPRVRRAAVTRLDEVPVLAEIARTDPDEDVRAEAIRNLAGIATESGDAEKASEIAQHLLALGRHKEIQVIVREGRHAAVRSAVVDLVSDQKTLGSLSRHAADGATRLRALRRLVDAEALANVALKSEQTDAAVAALERIDDPEALSGIAQRARNKVAARRARTKLRLMQETAQPLPASEPGAALSEEDLARAQELLQRAEALVAIADPAEASTALAAVRFGWAELQADAELDEALAARFESASDAAREAIAEREREEAADQARAEAVAREQADRLAIVREIESLSGPEAQDRIAELKVGWDTLPPMPSEYAASLTRRFQDACRAFEDRERRRMLAAAAAGRLQSLAIELEGLVASEHPVEEVVARWRGLRRDADVLREHAAANPEAAERLERAIAALETREQEQHQLRVKQEQDNLRRLTQICRQVEVLAASEQVSLKAGDRALREIRAALDDRSPLPTKQDRQQIQSRLEGARALLAPRIQEMRDADEWQRWANLQVQEDLVREMEALRAGQDLDRAARRMRELQARWKQVALAPRAQGEAMWRRFKTAQDEVFARTAAHVSEQNEQRGANLAGKQALCERAEALADSTDWVRTASEIQSLQAAWRNIGPVTRGHEKAVWERFRIACDRFFSRRQEDLKKRKEEWTANLVRKEQLCERAEALAESTDWDAAAGQIKALQAEWKSIGPVKKARSEVVWTRFRAACDRFFERYKHRDQLELLKQAEPREQIIRDLESIAAGSAEGEAPPDLLDRVQGARTRWQQAPELPRSIQQELAARYHQALGVIVGRWPTAFAATELDPEATRKRMEKLLSKVESLLSQPRPHPAASMSPAELLAQQWRERLASNTMGGRGESDDARWRAAEQEVKSAQAQWARFGPVPSDVAGPLNERFQRTVKRFYEQRRRAS